MYRGNLIKAEGMKRLLYKIRNICTSYVLFENVPRTPLEVYTVFFFCHFIKPVAQRLSQECSKSQVNQLD